MLKVEAISVDYGGVRALIDVSIEVAEGSIIALIGLSPLLSDQVFTALKRLNQEGLTILLVEQNARRALNISERAYVLEQGHIVKSGRSADLADDPSIIESYLGRQAVGKKPASIAAEKSN